jgi:hypothetical protein
VDDGRTAATVYRSMRYIIGITAGLSYLASTVILGEWVRVILRVKVMIPGAGWMGWIVGMMFLHAT